MRGDIRVFRLVVAVVVTIRIVITIGIVLEFEVVQDDAQNLGPRVLEGLDRAVNEFLSGSSRVHN